MMNDEFENKRIANDQNLKEFMFINTPTINADKLRNEVFDFKRNKKVDIKWAELFEQSESTKAVFDSIVLFEKYFNQHLSDTDKEKKLADCKDYYSIGSIKVLSGYEIEMAVDKSNEVKAIDPGDVLYRNYAKTFESFEGIFCLKHTSGRLYAFFDKNDKPYAFDDLFIGTIIMHPSEPPIVTYKINENLTIKEFWDKIIERSLFINVHSIKYVIPKRYTYDPRLVYQHLGFITLANPVRKKTPAELATLSPEETQLLHEILADENSFQETNTIRKDLNFYRQEFYRLDSQREFLMKVIAMLITTDPGSLDSFIKSQLENFWGNRDFLNSVSETYTTILTKKAIIEEKIDILVDRVKRFNYYLAKEDTTILIKELNKKITIVKGHIYRTEAVRGTYTQQIPASSFNYSDLLNPIGFPFLFANKSPIFFKATKISHRSLFGDIENIVGGAVGAVGGIVLGGGLLGAALRGALGANGGYRIIEIPYDDYIEVSFNNDPVQEEIQLLKSSGKQVFLVQKKDDEFYTQQGIPLSLIMKNCEFDEAFRRKCVIVIPFYEQILSDYNYQLGANFYINPLPGLIPTNFPRISFLEHLTYKLDWFSTEMGELVDSINLAPGESRNISLSAKFTETRANSDSYKSISDLNISTTNDLSTEFQNEISKNVVKNESFEGSAGFEMDGFGADASGSSNTTITDFSRQFTKIARKASENISKRLTTEINSSRSTTVQIDENSSRTSTISNINQGRTLNLFIYKLYNKYYSGIYLNKLQASLTSSIELIHGSGLYNRSDYNLSEGELAIFLTQLENYLYFLPKNVAANVSEIVSRIIREDLETYTGKNDKDPKFAGNPTVFPLVYQTGKLYDDDTETDKLMKMLSNLAYVKKNLNLEEIILPSGAYYIDSMVGLNPATEKYAEKMRLLEQLKKSEEIEKISNENDVIKTKKRLLEKDIAYINKISKADTLGIILVHFSKNILSNKPFFTSSKNFDRKWKIFMGDRYLPDVRVETSSDHFFAKLYWQDTSPDITELKQNLTMINGSLELKFISDE